MPREEEEVYYTDMVHVDILFITTSFQILKQFAAMTQAYVVVLSQNDSGSARHDRGRERIDPPSVRNDEFK